MKKLLFALALVLGCGVTTFANESDNTEQLYNRFIQYDYEIVVWKKLRNNGEPHQMMQILHKETGKNTMSWINNRINVLKRNYPGTPQEPVSVMNMIPYPSSDLDPILIPDRPAQIADELFVKY